MPDSERGFKILLFALGTATVVLLVLWAFSISQSERLSLQRWLPFLVKNPQAGETVFREKGCVNCHAVHGSGGISAPDLGQKRPDNPTLAQLVTAMWNHAPQMWDAMQAGQLSYPELTYDQTSELVAYLYLSRHADESGDAERGRQLFQEKGCANCHSVRGRGGHKASDLAALGFGSRAAWAQSMLNCAVQMKSSMEESGMPWPQFGPNELRDMLAFLRQVNPSPRPSVAFGQGDPTRGWEVFQSKSCLVCHSVKDEQGRLGPNLGPSGSVRGTFSDMATQMWNSMPKMEAEMNARGMKAPRFKDTELPDLLAFLYTLRYFEPTGSPQLGRTVFRSRGCARCHGDDALGGSAPALRGRTHLYNSIALAAGLWTHGREMYKETKQMGQSWPTLQESDIGDLLAFLNEPAKKKR
ncbi:MAG: c-type cytochrome [Terriglobales bacterium]